ncbi:hypothetical protein VSR01_01325 [Actinacidiphila sp. DG2A-62]|uniref:hypothetical protein n=1 Tax=Actinacidiphila sp. DG2A-62 TaxID=3108821 RepID=UPI002DBD90E5|nr:hypothetical protein [Actinacidiphila sp. DG2A-62]MEC3992257.1 hypothetical protein [Actinacidiphila sp. DG2A-62]
MRTHPLAARLDRLEQRASAHLFAFTTTAGRTVRATVDDVLSVLCGNPVPAHLAAVDGTPETASLAHTLVAAARGQRTAGAAA